MTLYLVRHAKAGDRTAWRGPDSDRPLTKPGRRQAEGLVPLLAPARPTQVLSSPHVRCVQTVEPLAASLGLVVEPVQALAEGQPPEPLAELLFGANGAPIVWCSHGDVIPDFVGYLQASHELEIVGEADWRKGATWVIERRGSGGFTGRALAPPV